jgi:broad specificity phosphatase PhoE
MQAAALAFRSKTEPIVAIYASALQRAVRTAQAIGAVHQVPVYCDARLNEIDMGAWEGLLYQEIRQRDPDLLRAWETDPRHVTPPGGESVEEAEQRVLSAVQEIAAQYSDMTVCLVAHKVTNALIRSHYLHLSLPTALQGEPQHAVWECIELPPERYLE